VLPWGAPLCRPSPCLLRRACGTGLIADETQARRWEDLADAFARRRSRILVLRGGGDDYDSVGRGGMDARADVTGGAETEDATTHEEAEKLWIRAVDAAPNDASLLFDYALFWQDDKDDWLVPSACTKQ